MSAFEFVESLSADPVERAIAERVMAILSNPRLGSAQRHEAVRQQQRELLRHRQQRDHRERLEQLAKLVRLEAGSQVTSVQVVDGRVLVGIRHPHRAFAWVDAGAAPASMGTEVPALAMPRGGHSRRMRGAALDPIDARRRELGQAPKAVKNGRN